MNTPYTPSSVESHPITRYQERANEIAGRHDDPSKRGEELLTLIEAQIALDNDPETHSLLKGEEAFYRGKYKAALKYYLSAQGVPNYHFYCYRASAYVSKDLGRFSKAENYAKKALNIIPNEPLSLALLEEVKGEGNATDQESSGEEESLRPFSIAEEELEELTHLFDVDKEEEEPIMTPTTDTTESRSTLLETMEPTELATATEDASSALDTLEQMAASDYQIERESTSRFLSDSLGVDMESGQTLESRIKIYQRGQVDAMSKYVERSMRRSKTKERFLTILNGWDYDKTTEATATLTEQLLPSHYRRTSGGYFIRWNEKGIVINPGKGFLENFHNAGHHIQEIDYVIVTRDDNNSCEDIRALYDLNYGYNKMAADLHIIRYYLNQPAHRALSNQLKPHFKQERNSVFCLDLYVDSPDLETVVLDDGISLHYFPTNSPDGSIGVKLELANNDISEVAVDAKNRITIGYVSGTPYSPVLTQHLAGSEILIAGFEGTGNNDYGKLKYNDDSLGFYGTATLLEEITPDLLLFSEFNGKEGDIRAEVARKLKQEFAFSSTNNTTILPADSGLRVNLESLRVLSTVDGEEVEPAQVRVAKTKAAFGKLQYLGPNSII